MTKEELIQAIKGMTLLELNDLVKACEEEFGVSASAPVAVASAAPVAAVEEKTEFDVILAEIGPNKLNVIKVVRELTSLGLAEAKKLVESAPIAVKEAVSKDEAASLKAKIEETGAKIEVK